MSGNGWSRSPGLILISLTALNALNYLDRYVGAAILPLILSDLKISDAQGGLLQSLFIVAYALACGPFGWLGDIGKRLRLIAGGVFVWSVATIASGLAPTYGWLLLARGVIGIGEASYAVITPSLLSDCYPAARRARVLGIFYAAIPVGTALGYILGGWIGESHGWRAAFFIAGAETLVLMIDGGDQLVAAELRTKLATQRQPVAGRGVERRVSEPVAIDAVEIGGLDASGP